MLENFCSVVTGYGKTAASCEAAVILALLAASSLFLGETVGETGPS